MKKLILLFLSVIFVFACHNDVIIESSIEPGTNNQVYKFSEEDIVGGRMRIKLKEEPAGKILVRSSNGEVTTGIRALDNSASAIKITQMERIFPHAGKFEERSRKEGLHLWYDVWFSGEVATTRATNELSILDEIEIAVPVLKVASTAAPAEPVFAKYIDISTRSNEYPFNDPYLSKQWGYHNPGTESWQQAGSDIRLFAVWQQYNGHPDIIISVVDGGIAPDNPDLQANLWINKREIAGNGLDDDQNGYVDDIHGYNFVSKSATITPHRHGTHVAGTIGATNNNEAGVGGIAGGNGSANSGVRLMSCQIFEHPPGNYYSDWVADNIPAAIKYGADNGAVISQNSWGYAADTQDSYIDPVDKAAIDYFVKYAGCDNDGNQLPGSPMKGGIVLFAAGNSNSSNPRTGAPADYEKVLGIASIGPDYKKPTYSNYGDYIDLCAPGGVDNTEKGIYSTTISELGCYEYRYGTSMSCPHVAGVAALVIEKNGVDKQGFTASQLEEILLTTAHSVDSYNPQYTGMLGTGCVDASMALLDTPSSDDPITLISNPVTDGILSFRVNADITGKALLTIINGMGSKVLRKNIETKKYTVFSLDISQLASGYYTLEYECNGSKIKEKFIKY